ncbi:MAG: metallophosphoesterase family protein [Gammaproteobacteria bacterium]
MTSTVEHLESPAAIATAPSVRRLGVIGDLHAEHRRLGQVLDWFAGQRVDAIVCTGDVADGRGCIEESCRLLEAAGVHVVAGNHDRWLLQNKVRHVPDAHAREALSARALDFLHALPRTRALDTVAGRLLLCHGIAENDMAKIWPGSSRLPVERSECLDVIIASDQYRFLINGHLHYRVLIDFERLLVMNAGTLRGAYAGVSIMDFGADTVSAYAVTDDEPPRPVAEQPLSPRAPRRIWRNTQCFDGAWEPLALYG